MEAHYPGCKKTKKLKNIFENYGFSELIKSPTRKDPVSGRESALDQIWTNAKKVIESGKTTGVSDHEGIFVKLTLEREKPKSQKITIRNFKNYNENKFAEDLEEKLENSNIDKLIAEKNSNEATIELTKIIRDTLDAHAPFIEINPKEKNVYIPWYNEELKEKIKIKKQVQEA